MAEPGNAPEIGETRDLVSLRGFLGSNPNPGAYGKLLGQIVKAAKQDFSS